MENVNETIKSNNPETVVEVSPDDLTSNNPISAVRTEPEATNNLMESGNSSMGNNSTQDEDTRNLGSNLNRLHLNKEKLSGAQKRKRARERAIAKGEPILPRKQRTNRKPRAAKDPKPDKSGVDGAMGPPTATPPPSDQRDKGKKRVLSSGSTPSPSQNPKKIAKRDPAAAQPSKTSGASYSGVTSAIKMSVFVGPEPETKMTPEQGALVQEAILQEIWKCQPGKGPKFNHCQVEHGMVHLRCTDNHAVEWLKTIIPQLKPWEGAVLRTLPSKEIAPRVRVSVWIPKEHLNVDDPTQTLRRLKTQNEGIDADNWKAFNIKKEPKGAILIVGMDESSLRELARKEYKLHLGFTIVTFRVLEPKPKNAEGNANKPSA
ncbi:unnamed protein product [Callosobruchus maculatus]|uniref:DUF4780 domain-containing protein n=1 Tax=Callosobruchus maculatus TaxID=64391 RepID=A0A653DJP5_CALMS|nr:unnamed protein product [Callosobruchus maculatus]